MTTIDLTEITALVAAGTITGRRHNRLPLTIYNYTAVCQYERRWCVLSLVCRGLILDDAGCVVGRPFPKFFNLEEHPEDEIPAGLPAEITEKMDGSLFTICTYRGERVYASRGAFASGQAQVGRRIFERDHGSVALDPAITYCFEVIYSANRIVVRYDFEGLVLLAMFHPDGSEHPLDDAPAGLRVVRRLPAAASPAQIRERIRPEEEGYVLRWPCGFRAKIKGSEYLRLHRIITGVGPVTIWERLRDGHPLAELVADVPDEFMAYVQEVASGLHQGHADLLNRIRSALADVTSRAGERKAQAAILMAEYRDISSAVFTILDGKSPDPWIWKQLRPQSNVSYFMERAGDS